MTRINQPMTHQRMAGFIEAYKASYGNFSAACRAMAPYSTSTVNPPARSTWLQLRERDSKFKQALEDAHAEVKDQIFEEVRNRALNGTLEPVYQKASRVWEPVVDENDQIVRDENGDPRMKPASITRFDSRLLLALARRIDPDWSEKHLHEHSGQVEHKLVTSADLLRMTPEQLETVERALEILGQKEEPKAITHEPGEILDTEFEEVEDDAIEEYERMQNG